MEKKVLIKAKQNKNHLYKYIKRKQNTQSIIGPFMRNNKVIEGTAANILRNQYMSVFTKPMEEYRIENPTEFFKFKNSCDDCEMERVHIRTDYTPDISFLTDFIVTSDDIKKAISKLKNNPGCFLQTMWQ